MRTVFAITASDLASNAMRLDEPHHQNQTSPYYSFTREKRSNSWLTLYFARIQDWIALHLFIHTSYNYDVRVLHLTDRYSKLGKFNNVNWSLIKLTLVSLLPTIQGRIHVCC